LETLFLVVVPIVVAGDEDRPRSGLLAGLLGAESGVDLGLEPAARVHLFLPRD